MNIQNMSHVFSDISLIMVEVEFAQEHKIVENKSTTWPLRNISSHHRKR